MLKKKINDYLPLPEKTVLVQAHVPESLHKLAYKLKETRSMEWNDFIINLLKYAVETTNHKKS